MIFSRPGKSEDAGAFLAHGGLDLAGQGIEHGRHLLAGKFRGLCDVGQNLTLCCGFGTLCHSAAPLRVKHLVRINTSTGYPSVKSMAVLYTVFRRFQALLRGKTNIYRPRGSARKSRRKTA